MQLQKYSRRTAFKILQSVIIILFKTLNPNTDELEAHKGDNFDDFYEKQI